jgi:hypothetical protein
MTTPATTTATPTDKPVPVGKTLPPVRAGMAGLMPTSVDEMWRLAQYAAASDIVPKDFRNKPYNVLIAMEHGLECGVPWLHAVQGTAIINGRPGFYGDLFLAVIMDSPHYVKHDEYFLVKNERRDGLVADDWKDDSTAAVCTFWRRGVDQPTTRRFTVGQARKAKLLSKEGPWQEYPDRQLQMRARGFAGRDTFPDVLKGMGHPAEELRDLPPEPVIVTPDREVRRMSETRHDFGIDRTADTRLEDAPPITEAQIVVGPLTVINVEPFLGLFTVTLADGSKIDTTEAADAMELEKVKGTAHAFRFTCTRTTEGNLHLVSFSIAD